MQRLKVNLLALCLVFGMSQISCKTSNKQVDLDSGTNPENSLVPSEFSEGSVSGKAKSLSLADQMIEEINHIRGLCLKMSDQLSEQESQFCQKLQSTSDEALVAFFRTSYLNTVIQGRILQAHKANETGAEPSAHLYLTSGHGGQSAQGEKKSYREMTEQMLAYSAAVAVLVLGAIELDATWKLMQSSGTLGKGIYGAWGAFIAISVVQHIGHLMHDPTIEAWYSLGNTFIIAGLFSFGVGLISLKGYMDILRKSNLASQINSKIVPDVEKGITKSFKQYLTDIKDLKKILAKNPGDFKINAKNIEAYNKTLSKGSQVDSKGFHDTLENKFHGIDGEFKAGAGQLIAAGAFIAVGFTLSMLDKREKAKGKEDKTLQKKNSLHLATAQSFQDALKSPLSALLDLAESDPQVEPSYPEFLQP